MNKITHSFLKKILGFVLICLTFSCVSHKPLHMTSGQFDCQSSDNALRYDSLFYNSIAANVDTTGLYTILEGKFSHRSIRVAKNFNLYSVLGQYIKAQTKEEKLAAKIQINQITDIHALGMMDFSAVITCEKLKLLEAREHLEDWKSRRINRATVASIIIGGIAGVAASAVNLNELDNEIEQTIAITGAVLGTYLGFKSLSVKKTIIITHPQNLIREIWENPQKPDNIPTNIHVFLTTPFYLHGKMTSGKELMKAHWEAKDLTSNKKVMDLILSNGGEYDNNSLTIRLQLMESFAEEMRIMQYDLKRLIQEFVIYESQLK